MLGSGHDISLTDASLCMYKGDSLNTDEFPFVDDLPLLSAHVTHNYAGHRAIPPRMHFIVFFMLFDLVPVLGSGYVGFSLLLALNASLCIVQAWEYLFQGHDIHRCLKLITVKVGFMLFYTET